MNLFDPTGETAVAAGTAIGVGGLSKLVEIVGAVIIWGLSNLFSNTPPMEASSSNASSKTVSKSVDWDVSDNKKNHIVHGSKKGGGHDWNKFNIDPNDPNSWSKILPLLKEVVDSGKQTASYPTQQGTVVAEYVKHFAEYGTSIIVKLYSDTPGVMFISDAYPLR